MFCNIAMELSIELSGLLGLELPEEAAETAVASWTCCMYWARAAWVARLELPVFCWPCMAVCSCWVMAAWPSICCRAEYWEYCSDSPDRYSSMRAFMLSEPSLLDLFMLFRETVS